MTPLLALPTELEHVDRTWLLTARSRRSATVGGFAGFDRHIREPGNGDVTSRITTG
jgi:hypothetical protein